MPIMNRYTEIETCVEVCAFYASQYVTLAAQKIVNTQILTG